MKKLQTLIKILVIIGTLMLFLTGCGTASGAEEVKHYTVGVVNISSGLDVVFESFQAEMTQRGYVEGENITYLYDGATSIDSLESTIRPLVEQEVDLILSITTPATLQAKQLVEGTNIPVVFVPVTDPIASGVVDNLQTPGGNLTGIKSGGSVPRALDWLMTIAPDTSTIYVFHNPSDNSSIQGLEEELKPAATDAEVSIVLAEVSTDEELMSVLDNIPDEIDSAFILPSGFMVSHANKIAEVMIEQKIPTSTILESVEDGMLVSYGIVYQNLGEQAANLGEQVLLGSDPGTLPIEDARFSLSINLATAEKIGLEIADTILQQADVIIR